jgi:GTPase-associated system helical domain
LDEISAKAEVGDVDLATPIQQMTTTVSTYVAEAMKAFSSATLGLQRRTNLIWWKEALYSPSKQKSYRAFPRTIASALMAFDLYQQIPLFSPASVSAFLEEAVYSLPSTAYLEQRPLREILLEACEDGSIDVLRIEAAKLFATPSGRSPILALIAHPEKLNGLKDDELKAITGVSLDVPINDAQWASWLVRDLQAGRATKEPPKRRAAKGAA